jgi:hypothetical protein
MVALFAAGITVPVTLGLVIAVCLALTIENIALVSTLFIPTHFVIVIRSVYVACSRTQNGLWSLIRIIMPSFVAALLCGSLAVMMFRSWIPASTLYFLGCALGGTVTYLLIVQSVRPS